MRLSVGDVFALSLAVSAAVTGCGPSSRRLEYARLESAALGKPIEYGLLRPPPGPDGDDVRLPVIYLLHGAWDDHRSLDSTGLSDGFLEAMKRGDIPRTYIVTPEGERGFWINWHDGTRRYEDYVLNDLLPDAEKRLGIEPGRERRYLAGVSMGGLGALHIGLRHPDLFSSVACLSGLVLDEREAVDYIHDSVWARIFPLQRVFGDGTDREFLVAHNPYAIVRARRGDIGTRLFLAAGRDEDADIRKHSEEFHEWLARQGVEHEWELYPGEHSWKDWFPVLLRAIRFMTRSS